MKHGANLPSPLVLFLNISWPLHYLMRLIEFSHIFHVVPTLLDLNASSFNEKANIEEPSFFVSLEGDFSSCDTIDEKEVTYGDDIDIYDDPITH